MSAKQDKKLRKLTNEAVQNKRMEVAKDIFATIHSMKFKARFVIAMQIIFSPIKQKLKTIF